MIKGSIRAMLSIASFAGLLGAQSGVFRPGQSGLQSTEVPVTELIMGQGKQVDSIAAEQIPGMGEADRRLSGIRCAEVVAGSDLKGYARARLYTVNYYRFRDRFLISAVQRAKGNIEVMYGLAYVEERRVLFFNAFFEPENILTWMNDGSAIRQNLLRQFEKNHGLRENSVTPEILAAMVILHEHTHFNGTAIHDADTMVHSMINTRRVAEACFPELIHAPAHNLLTSWMQNRLVSFLRILPKGCPTCHLNQRLEALPLPNSLKGRAGRR